LLSKLQNDCADGKLRLVSKRLAEALGNNVLALPS
jgi:hypothetical protein